jgi:hypothetical protein
MRVRTLALRILVITLGAVGMVSAPARANATAFAGCQAYGYGGCSTDAILDACWTQCHCLGQGYQCSGPDDGEGYHYNCGCIAS